jgi:hypothetical protein
MPHPSKFVEFHGPATWKALHSIAFNFALDPDRPLPEEQRAAVDFFGALQHLLPCEFCRRHYRKHLGEHPVDASSREALARWVYELHSAVNRRRHVPDMPFEEVRELYTGWSPDRAAALAALPEQERLRRLADPHFGRRAHTHADAVAGAAERAAGEGEAGGGEGGVSPAATAALLLGAGAAAAATYYLWARPEGGSEEPRKKMGRQ